MPTTTHRSWRYILLLILAGEAIFILPFVLVRVFRPTVLAVYGIDNTDIGLCFSAYGFVALGAYLLGGPLADRFPPRKLMGTALLLTAAGGPVYAAAPSLLTLKILYGYWGFTTIFLFWAAMIKATRIWGGDKAQGRAFGLLDGGRGLTGALISLLGVTIFGYLVGEGTGAMADSAGAFRVVVLTSSALIAGIGVLVFFFLRAGEDAERSVTVDRITMAQVRPVLRLPSVWLLMVIILCAYVGYKVTDVISLYASDVMGYDEVGAAQTGTFLLFLRPVAGIGAGFLADLSRPSRYLIGSFTLSILGGLLFASGWLEPGRGAFFFFTVILTATGVYAGRALYFAVLREGRIPLALTGTAVGLISFVGYTPDIFASLLTGYFLDTYPGAAGHYYVFYMLVGFSLVGLAAAMVFRKVTTRRIQS
ncbi:MAG: MFS transporter [Bacteroidota bacterium]